MSPRKSTPSRTKATPKRKGKVTSGAPYNSLPKAPPPAAGALRKLTQDAHHEGPPALFPPKAPEAPAPKFLTPAGLMGIFRAVHQIPVEALPPVIREALEAAKASAMDTPPEGHQLAFTPAKEYASLFNVLVAAYNQAASGKGAERHANSLPYEQQPMQAISGLLHSSEGLRWQAIKKIQESHSILTKALRSGDPENVKAARAFHRKELLGAINYLAGALIFEGGE